MSRSREYQRLLNDRRWKELRALKLSINPLCEMCEKEGYVVAAVDCHHIKPVESGKTDAEMQALAYDLRNLQSLCIPCHIKIHKERRSHTKSEHQRRASEDLQRWIERHRKK